MPLHAEDTVYELGSGYGRLVFYLAATTPAQIVGLELYPPRFEESRRIQEQLNLERVTLLEGDASKRDLSDGTVFIIFNSFDSKTLQAVALKLQQVARHKQIRIISSGPSNYFFSTQRDWLRPTTLISLYRRARPSESTIVFESF